MIAALVFEGASLEDGLHAGREIIIEMLDSLTFATSSKFTYRKSIKLVDWTDGSKEREYNAYQPFPGHDLPYEVLDPYVVGSGFALWASTRNERVEQSIHWFSSAIAAASLEDQFQLFWFSIEITAGIIKKPEKVHDKCQKCSSPLYCEQCEIYPKHRPFNKQVIATLFDQFFGDDEEQKKKRAFDVRNMLLHGEPKVKVESEIGCGLDEVVEDVGQIARFALRPLVEEAIKKSGVVPRAVFLEKDEFVRKTLHLTTRLRSGEVKPDFKNLEDLVVPEMSLIISRDGQSPEDAKS